MDEKNMWQSALDSLKEMSTSLALTIVIGMFLWLNVQNDRQANVHNAEILTRMADTEEKRLEQTKIFTEVLTDLLRHHEQGC